MPAVPLSEPPDLKPGDILIAVMGLTGSGKTTFVNLFADYNLEVGYGLEFGPQHVGVVPCTLPGGKKIFLVETPGFDDAYRTKSEILLEVAVWLNAAHKSHIKLTGIIYLHPISAVRVGGSGVKDLRTFKKLCGDDGLKSVILATTMWDHTGKEVGERREAELRSSSVLWRPMIDQGSKVFRQDAGHASGLKIITYLIDLKQPVTLDIQREMVDQKLQLGQTGAGADVASEVEKAKQYYDRRLKDLETQLGEALSKQDHDWMEEIEEMKAEYELKISQGQEELRRMQADSEQLPMVYEEMKQHDEEMKQHNEEMKQHDEEMKQHNEEMKQHDEEMKQHNEEMKQHDEEMKQHNEEMKQHDEEMKQRDEEMQQRNKEMQQRDEEMQQRNKEMQQRDEEMKQRDEKEMADMAQPIIHDEALKVQQSQMSTLTSRELLEDIHNELKAMDPSQMPLSIEEEVGSQTRLETLVVDEAHTGSIEAESTLAGTTLVDSQGGYPFEPKQSSSLTSTDLNIFQGEDCMSVESDNEDIKSLGWRRRTEPEILAVRQFGLFLGELESLRPLHEDALKRLGMKRFQDNYRKILKKYVLKLRVEAQTAIEKDTVLVLQSRWNRLHIAQRIADLVQEVEEDNSKELEDLTQQPVKKQSLEDWAKNAYASEEVETVESFEAEPEGYEQSSDDTDSEDAEDKHDLEALRFPNISQANMFLLRGIPFQMLHLELRLLVLPASIRDMLQCTPKRSISISSMIETSFANKIKAYIEEYTAFEWDWWPLLPRLPDLPPGRSCLQWEFCGQYLHKEISKEEGDSIQQNLGAIGDHPSKCFCCETKPHPTNWKKVILRMYQSIANALHWERLNASLAAQNSSSKAQRLYTPATAAAPSALPTPPYSQTQTMPPTTPGSNSGGITQANGGGSNSNFAGPQGDPSWIVFGVRDMHEYDGIENIDMSTPFNDPLFFKELKKRYRKYRWFCQRWFSPFRFRHCKFVQFEVIHVDQVYCTGESLPDDYGYTSLYEYDPRPPRASNPLISPRLFSICLKACDADCSWSLLPSALHRCRPLPHNSHIWKRIPRKKSAFNIGSGQPGEVAFGIEADYSLSFLILFIYHFVLICPAFGFWIYWLKNHPNDIQNASVPTFCILGLIGALWVLLGRRVDIS